MSAEILCTYSLPLFCSYLKSLGQKLIEKMRNFVNSDYITFCDLQGHRRSDALVQNERLYSVYEFISMSNCNYRLSGTLAEI